MHCTMVVQLQFTVRCCLGNAPLPVYIIILSFTLSLSLYNAVIPLMYHITAKYTCMKVDLFFRSALAQSIIREAQ